MRRGVLAMPLGGAQELQNQQPHGHKIGERAGHPHQDPCGCLVVESRDAPEAWDGEIGGIEDTLREDQGCRQGRVLEIGEEQVGDHGPAGPTRSAGPGLQDRPPEEQACAEETEVLHVVPAV